MMMQAAKLLSKAALDYITRPRATKRPGRVSPIARALSTVGAGAEAELPTPPSSPKEQARVEYAQRKSE